MGKLFRNSLSFERENFIERINSFPENTFFYIFVGETDVLFTRSSVSSISHVNIVSTEHDLPFSSRKTELISKVSLMDKLEPQDETYEKVFIRYWDSVIDLSDKKWIDEMDHIDKYLIAQPLPSSWGYDDQGSYGWCEPDIEIGLSSERDNPPH